MKDEAIQILQNHKLRVTEARVSMLCLFLKSDGVYSFSDLEEKLKNCCDRSTIFRSLKCLIRYEILEQFINSNGETNYLILHEDCECSSKSHFHFKCTSCEKVSHLPKLPSSYLSKLGNSTISSLNLVIEGVCEDCQ